jgi:hypothetical protein
LPVANGGTGVTTSTGSGNVVLSTSPTLVTPILGTPTSGTLTNTTGFPAANLAGTALPAAIVTSSLTAVGTIATGVWNGTTIAVANGGTGQTTYTNGQLLIGNTTGNTLTKATLTAGSGITITNGSGAITIASSGGASQATPTVLGTVYASTLDLSGNATTAVGYQACRVDVGSSNTALGATALYTNTSGARNVAVGYGALYTNNGTENVGIGVSALQLNTSGGANTALGYYALQANTTATSNTAIGYYALSANTTGTLLTAVGYRALASNNNATSPNTAVGADCLYSNTSGYSNIAVGVYTMRSTTTGTNNVAMGRDAMYYNTSGGSNVAIGDTALIQNTSGSYNVSLGDHALASNTTSNASLAIGAFSMQSSTGAGNIGVGHGTGQNGVSITTGTYNICVGVNASTSAATDTNEITISANSGNNSQGRGSNTGYMVPGSGGMYQGNNSATWSVSSDQRLKKNIVDNNVGLDKVAQIQVRNFEYRTEDEITELPKNQAIKKQGVQLGVIAQELQAILPDCIKEESTGVFSVNSENITWHLINAIKELNAKVIALEARLGA